MFAWIHKALSAMLRKKTVRADISQDDVQQPDPVLPVPLRQDFAQLLKKCDSPLSEQRLAEILPHIELTDDIKKMLVEDAGRRMSEPPGGGASSPISSP